MPSPLTWHVDVDVFLNPILPPSPLRYLPYPIAHFLGYRTTPTRPLGNVVLAFWAFVGVFGSIAIIEAVARAIPELSPGGLAPICIGSFGAAAVLDFYAIESPLAQPRNAVIGQLLSSVVGVAFRKLFSESDRFADLRWLASGLSCATATAVMALTGTVHPPAGATALLAVADDDLAALGWLLVPVVLMDCVLMLGVALLVNNSLRRYPVYWWSPERVGGWWVGMFGGDDGGKGKLGVDGSGSGSGSGDEEKMEGEGSSSGRNVIKTKTGRSHHNHNHHHQNWRSGSESSGPVDAHIEFGHTRSLIITRGEVLAPDDMFLRPEERMLLEALSQRL